MPNLLKKILLYFFVCGFPRLFAMAWPAIVAGLERLLTRKTPPPQREEKAEAKAPPSGPQGTSQRRNNRKKRSRANQRRGK